MSDPTGNPKFDELLQEYVERALALQQQGIGVDLDLLCREHPELATAVAEALNLAPDLVHWQRRASAGQDRLLGTVLVGRYRLETLIGRGAMGSVYAGTDAQLEREVAIKVLHPSLFSEDADGRFEREATILARLEHANVVRIYDRGETDDGTRFLVTERLIGVSLAAIVQELVERDGARPGSAGFLTTDWLREHLDIEPTDANYVRVAVRWVAQLADGLEVAHTAGVFHRDVKPSNAFVRRTGQAVLLDFGIAVHSSDVTAIAADGLGTPSYMAPEQVGGGTKATAAVDVYGLAATLYHLLTGRPPYSGDPRSVLAQIARVDPTPAVRLHPGLPRDLQAILDRGMARRLADRYADASELRSDLYAFLDHRPVQARPLRPWTRTWRKISRAPEARVLAVVTVLLALIGAVWFWRTERASNRRAEHAELRTHRPATIGLSGAPDRRRIVNDAERIEIAGHLDRAIELAPSDLVDRVHRATFRLDHGDSEGAAADMRALAEVHESGYLVALAARYVALEPGSDGHDHLELGGLPEPTSDVGRYVAAYHALRGKTLPGYRRADALLEPAAARGFVPAFSLRLLSMLVLANLTQDPEARLAAFRRVEAAALEQRGRLGRHSARTAHVAGSALLAQGRYADALPVLRQCVELWGWSHTAIINLADALEATDQLESAEAMLRRAIELRPFAWKSLRTLVQVQIKRGEFGAARSTIARLPESLGPGEGFIRHQLAGNAYFAEALMTTDGAAVGRLAKQARLEYQQAKQSGWEESIADQQVAACVALERGDDTALANSFLNRLIARPADSHVLRMLLETMPERPNERTISLLGDYLRSLVRHFVAAGR